ncbi:MAG: hypothetical protein ABSG86_07260 [Thermoguttaceae bacterium]|jgi:hypothetical protein
MKLVRIVAAGLAVAALAAGWTGRAQGWSLLHPFGGDEPQAKPAKPAPKQFGSPTGKTATGSKGFFSSPSPSMGFQKTPPKKSTSAFGTLGGHPAGSLFGASKKPPSKPSFLSSLNPFHHEEPKKPKSMGDFVGGERP